MKPGERALCHAALGHVVGLLELREQPKELREGGGALRYGEHHRWHLELLKLHAAHPLVEQSEDIIGLRLCGVEAQIGWRRPASQRALP